MFESRHRSSGGNSANRWLLVAGAGLVILAFVARMLLDIGHTRVSDLAAVMRPDTTASPGAPTIDTAPAVSTTAIDTPAVPPPPGTSTLGTVSPPVLKPDTITRAAPNPPPAPPVPATGGGYAVQIGAFGSEPNATKLATRASGLGYATEVIPPARGGTSLYVVQVRGLSGASEARLAADSLTRTLGVKSVVVSPGK